jgi:hypothetical protein
MPRTTIGHTLALADAAWAQNAHVDEHKLSKLLKSHSYASLQKMAKKMGIDYHVSKEALAKCIVVGKNIFFPHETGYIHTTLRHFAKQLVGNIPTKASNNELRALLVERSDEKRMASHLVHISKLFKNVQETEESWCSEEVRTLLSAVSPPSNHSLQSYIRAMMDRQLQIFEAWKSETSAARKQVLFSEMEKRREASEHAIEEYTDIIKRFCSTGCTRVPEEMQAWAKQKRFRTTLVVCNVKKFGANIKFKRKEKFANGFVVDKVLELKDPQVVWLGLGKGWIAGAWWNSDEEKEEEEEESHNELNSDESPTIIQLPPGFVVAAQSELPVQHLIAVAQPIGIQNRIVQASALAMYDSQPVGIARKFRGVAAQPVAQTLQPIAQTQLESTALSLVKEGLQFSANQLLEFVMNVAFLHSHRAFFGMPQPMWEAPAPVYGPEPPPNVQITEIFRTRLPADFYKPGESVFHTPNQSPIPANFYSTAGFREPTTELPLSAAPHFVPVVPFRDPTTTPIRVEPAPHFAIAEQQRSEPFPESVFHTPNQSPIPADFYPASTFREPTIPQPILPVTHFMPAPPFQDPTRTPIRVEPAPHFSIAEEQQSEPFPGVAPASIHTSDPGVTSSGATSTTNELKQDAKLRAQSESLHTSRVAQHISTQQELFENQQRQRASQLHGQESRRSQAQIAQVGRLRSEEFALREALSNQLELDIGNIQTDIKREIVQSEEVLPLLAQRDSFLRHLRTAYDEPMQIVNALNDFRTSDPRLAVGFNEAYQESKALVRELGRQIESNIIHLQTTPIQQSSWSLLEQREEYLRKLRTQFEDVRKLQLAILDFRTQDERLKMARAEEAYQDLTMITPSTPVEIESPPQSVIPEEAFGGVVPVNSARITPIRIEFPPHAVTQREEPLRGVVPANIYTSPVFTSSSLPGFTPFGSSRREPQREEPGAVEASQRENLHRSQVNHHISTQQELFENQQRQRASQLHGQDLRQSQAQIAHTATLRSDEAFAEELDKLEELEMAREQNAQTALDELTKRRDFRRRQEAHRQAWESRSKKMQREEFLRVMDELTKQQKIEREAKLREVTTEEQAWEVLADAFRILKVHEREQEVKQTLLATQEAVQRSFEDASRALLEKQEIDQRAFEKAQKDLIDAQEAQRKTLAKLKRAVIEERNKIAVVAVGSPVEHYDRFRFREARVSLTNLLAEEDRRTSYRDSLAYAINYGIDRSKLPLMPLVLQGPDPRPIPDAEKAEVEKELAHLFAKYDKDPEFDKIRDDLIIGIAGLENSNAYRIQLREEEWHHAIGNVSELVRNREPIGPGKERAMSIFGKLLNEIVFNSRINNYISISGSMQLKLVNGKLDAIYHTLGVLANRVVASHAYPSNDPTITVMKQLAQNTQTSYYDYPLLVPDMCALITDASHSWIVDNYSQEIIANDAATRNSDPDVSALQYLMSTVVDIRAIVSDVYLPTAAKFSSDVVKQTWNGFQLMYNVGIPTDILYSQVIQALSFGKRATNAAHAQIVLPVYLTTLQKLDNFIFNAVWVASQTTGFVTTVVDPKLKYLTEISNEMHNRASEVIALMYDVELKLQNIEFQTIEALEIAYFQLASGKWQRAAESKLEAISRANAYLKNFAYQYGNPYLQVVSQPKFVERITPAEILKVALRSEIYTFDRVSDPLNATRELIEVVSEAASHQVEIGSAFAVVPAPTASTQQMTTPTIALAIVDLPVNPFVLDFQNMFIPSLSRVSKSANLWGVSQSSAFPKAIRNQYAGESDAFIEKAMNADFVYVSTPFGMEHLKPGPADMLLNTEIVPEVAGSFTLQNLQGVDWEQSKLLYGQTLSSIFQSKQVSQSLLKVLIDIPILQRPIRYRLMLASFLTEQLTVEYVDQLGTWVLVRGETVNLVAPIDIDNEVFGLDDIPRHVRRAEFERLLKNPNVAWDVGMVGNQRKFYVHRSESISTFPKLFFTVPSNDKMKRDFVARAAYAMLSSDKLTNPHSQEPEELLMRMDEIVGFAKIVEWNSPDQIAALVQALPILRDVDHRPLVDRIHYAFRSEDNIYAEIMLSEITFHPGAHMLHLLHAQNPNQFGLAHVLASPNVKPSDIAKRVDQWITSRHPSIAKTLDSIYSQRSWNQLLVAMFKLNNVAQFLTIGKSQALTDREYFQMQPRLTLDAMRKCLTQSVVFPTQEMTLENLDAAMRLESGPILSLEDIRHVGALAYKVQQMQAMHPDKYYTWTLLFNVYLAASPAELTPQIVYDAILSAFITVQNMKAVSASVSSPEVAWNQTAINIYETLKHFDTLEPIPDFGNHFGVLDGNKVIDFMNTAQEIVQIPVNKWSSTTTAVINQLASRHGKLRATFENSMRKSSGFRKSFARSINGLAETCRLGGCETNAYMWNLLTSVQTKVIGNIQREGAESLEIQRAKQAQDLAVLLHYNQFLDDQLRYSIDQVRKLQLRNPMEEALKRQWDIEQQERDSSWSWLVNILSISQQPHRVVDLLLGSLLTGTKGSSFVRTIIQTYAQTGSNEIDALLEFAGFFILEKSTTSFTAGLRLGDDTLVQLTPSLRENSNNDPLVDLAFRQSAQDQTVFSNLPRSMAQEILSQDQFNVVELFSGMTSPEIARSWITGNVQTPEVLEYLSTNKIVRSMDLLTSAHILHSQNALEESVVNALKSDALQDNLFTKDLHMGISKGSIFSAMAETVSTFDSLRQELRNNHNFQSVLEGFLQLGNIRA